MTKNTSNHAIKYIDPNYVLVCIHCNIMSPNRGGRGERRRRRRKKRRKPETPKRKRRAEKKRQTKKFRDSVRVASSEFCFLVASYDFCMLESRGNTHTYHIHSGTTRWRRPRRYTYITLMNRTCRRGVGRQAGRKVRR